MTGTTYYTEEVQKFTTILQRGGRQQKSFCLDTGKRCKKFQDYDQFDIDNITRRLYKGLSMAIQVQVQGDSISVGEIGKPRLVLAFDKQDDHVIVKDYLLHLCASNPSYCKHLQKHRVDTQKGLRDFHSDVTPVLSARFEFSPPAFLNSWDQQYLKVFMRLGEAYSDVLAERHDGVSRMDALALEVHQHKQLIQIIIEHCDDVFDTTQDDLESIKQTLRVYYEENKNAFARWKQVTEQVNTYDGCLGEVEGRVAALEGRVGTVEEQVAVLRGQIEALKLERSAATDSATDTAKIVEPDTSDTEDFDAKVHRGISNELLEEFEQLCSQGSNKAAARFSQAKFSGADLQTLLPGNWLNGDIIDAFFKLLKKRDKNLNGDCADCGFLTSYFYTKLTEGAPASTDMYNYETVNKWGTSAGGIFGKKVYVPVNLDRNHWILAMMDARIETNGKTVELFDSCRRKNKAEKHGAVTANLTRYLADEHLHKQKAPLNISQWTMLGTNREAPIQTNGFDCGVFVCMYAYFLTLGNGPAEFQFDKEWVNRYGRNFIACSILKGSIE
mmetsp:Transcript_23014/g.54619  ORF Transcript_23014/g.54619 Transcript_23014/m.54619 type:complete len:556 (+) Transcript_23014:112-1779(+)|eukprot:CAMPEP_0113445944 /NCGR_PEP_ID=MMETSP0014_2-20120614/3448_1 /TAXON_ID=2857 /ORGANISM="Nitzschia sp." /LENGTH=555 /DNA_ID=CAMNT_0000337013 /DNA_START=75 /DNA_END=1742 /DNA_ORIENTATION=+ /assembly_acc=CAM_ASM_000159